MRSKFKRVLAFTASLAMCSMTFLHFPTGTFDIPMTASAAESDGMQTVLDISCGDIIIGDGTLSGYGTDGTEQTESDPDGYIITGTSTEYTVTVNGGTHQVTLDNADIDASGTGEQASSDISEVGVSAFAVNGPANVALTLSGTNALTGGVGCAGLYVASDASVTIDGNGSLDAKGSYGGAGIGANVKTASGAVTINSGTITAAGSSYSIFLGAFGHAAGIGGSSTNAVGTITINGGTITAMGSNYIEADIGSGAAVNYSIETEYVSADATVIINGGNIHAETIGVGKDNTSDPAPVSAVQNSAGENVSLQSFTILNAEDGTAVSGGTGFPADFGFGGVATIDNMLYCWMPDGTEVTAITAGENRYTKYESGTFIPDDILAADPALDLSEGNIVFSLDQGVPYYTVGGGEKQYYSGNATITDGDSTTNTITVESGTHDIILDNVNSSPAAASPLSIAGGAAANVTLVGENILTGGASSLEAYAGIYVPENASLTIDGDGSLEAIGSYCCFSDFTHSTYFIAAGIGSDGYGGNVGTITIESGTVNAVGGSDGNYSAYGIGSGFLYNGGNTGDYGTCTAVNLTGGVVTADTVQSLTQTGGILIQDGNATVMGENTLTEELTIASGKRISFVNGGFITNPELLIIADDAIIYVDGVKHLHNTDGTVTYETMDEIQHTKRTVCMDCPVGYVAESAEEHSGGTANCQNPAECEFCGTEYGEIDPDTHVPTYSASGNTITASCSEICDYSGSAVITAVEKVYDREPAEIKVTADGVLSDAELPVTYTMGGEPFAGEPVNAGDYTASITYGGVTASVNFTIAKADAIVKASPTPNTLGCSGTAQNLISQGEAEGGTMLYALSEDGDYSTTIPEAVNAGKYTVWYYVQGDENHNDTPKACIEAEIAKAKITVLTPPEAVTLTEYYTNAEDIIAQLPAAIVIEAEDGTAELPVAWTLTGEYDAASLAKNTFAWTADIGELDASGVTVSGEITVTNMEYVAINEENFPDENFRTYVDTNFDATNDAILTMEEIAAVTHIDVSDMGIKALTGVEYFTALNYLYCSGNQLTSLDVSNHTALTYLDCSENQLTSLDVSNHTALTNLYCSANQLTSLDVSNNAALISLHCRENQLTSLDLSQNTELMELDCGVNQLTSLDVSNHTALKYLHCSGNQLTSLDVSNHTALISLDCSENQLTSLDVSNHTALTDLDCRENQLTSLDVSNNAALTGLYCSRNLLTSLDLSKNTELIVLSCGVNQLTTLDLSQNTELMELDCGVNQLTDLDVSKNNALIYLSCSANQLTDLDVSKNNALIYLSCGENQLTSLDVSQNAELLDLDIEENLLRSLDVSGCEKLEYLDCDNNQLENVDVSKNTMLYRFDCSNNLLTSLDVSKNTMMDDLDCSSNLLTSLDVSVNTALTELNCSSNLLTSLNVSQNPALTELNCSSNQLTSLDVSQNPALTELNADSHTFALGDVFCVQEFAPEGFDAAKASGWTGADYKDGKLSNITGREITYQYAVGYGDAVMRVTLKIDSLSHIISDGTACAGCGELAINAVNFPDEVFRAYVNDYFDTKDDDVLTAEEIAAVEQMIVSNMGIKDLTGVEHFTALTDLDCSENQLTSLDVSRNTALTDLHCDNNQLTSLDVSQNTALTDLDCSENQLTSLDVSRNTALITLICDYNKLTSLDVHQNTGLLHLYCVGNQLTALDVSKNTALVELCCYTNELTSLDVSNNTALIYLDCSRNLLTALDVSKNTALTNLYCDENQLTSLDVSDNKDLRSFNCSENQLTSLDVSKNKDLFSFNCSENQLTTLDLSQNTVLRELNSSNNQLATLDLSQNTELMELHISNNQLTTLDVSNNTMLIELDCSNNQLTSLDLSQNMFLSELNCTSNSYEIGLIAGTFDLTTLPEGFTITKAGDWTNAAVEGNILTVNNMNESVYYTYELIDGLTECFELKPVSCTITEDMIAPIENAVYSGSELKPVITVMLGEKQLTENIDYTVTYENNVSAGTATATITGVGNFIGTAEVSWTIEKAVPEIIPPTASELTYGQTLGESELSDSAWTWFEPSRIPTVHNSGYVAFIIVEDSRNYDYSSIEGYEIWENVEVVARVIPVNVNKAAPTVTPIIPEGEYTEGDALPELLYQSETDGLIAWMTELKQLIVGENVLEWQFTPEDQDNYEAVTGTAIVEAKATTTTTETTTTTTTTETTTTTTTETTTTTTATTESTTKVATTTESGTTVTTKATTESTTKAITTESGTTATTTATTESTTKATTTESGTTVTTTATTESTTKATTTESGTTVTTTATTESTTKATTTTTESTTTSTTKTTTTTTESITTSTTKATTTTESTTTSTTKATTTTESTTTSTTKATTTTESTTTSTTKATTTTTESTTTSTTKATTTTTESTTTSTTKATTTTTESTTTTTTESTTTITGYTYVVEAKDPSFYFSHDTSEFQPEELIASVTRYAVYSDGTTSENGEILDDFDAFDFGGLTPEILYTQECSEYYVSLNVADEFGTHTITEQVKAYIGVKGDANLDGMADAKDAAKLLEYAAAVGAGQDMPLYSDSDETSENLAHFLAEVNASGDADAKDAALILEYAAAIGSGEPKTWDEILGAA